MDDMERSMPAAVPGLATIPHRSFADQAGQVGEVVGVGRRRRGRA